MSGVPRAATQGEPAAAAPLYVDLDGTVLATDLLWESLLSLIPRQPMSLLLLPIWLLGGKARLKSEVARRVAPDVAFLPYREEVLGFIERERKRGRRVILATAADRRLADAVAAHLGTFSAVLASDGRRNLAGTTKLEAIARDAAGCFDYMGNSRADEPIWRAARHALLVQPRRGLLRRARREATVSHVLAGRQQRGRALWSALRPAQWVKNVLLFVPLILAHEALDPRLLLQASWAFVAFSLCASSVYVANDLLDLQHDRRHSRKRERPFASGRLELRTGALLAPGLLLAGLGVAWLTLPTAFGLLLLAYVALSTSYSLVLKRLAIVDVVVLAGLYTLRVISGGVAVDVALSPWLLAFSLFFFFSLALVKRYSELHLENDRGKRRSAGRSYVVDDLPIIRTIGPASGYLAVLVLALYMNSEMVTTLYDRPAVLWAVTPMLLYWITRVWFLANRGVVADDPIVFTLKDPVSYLVGFLVAVLLLGATL